VTPGPAPAPGLGARLAAASRDDAVRERFLRAVFAEVPLERVAEVHLFAPMRQGGTETGIAVVAARLDADDEAAAPGVDGRPDRGPSDLDPEPAPPADAAPESETAPAPDSPSAGRHTVYTARYRLAIKGPDRGRWQVDVRAEADAPLLTVDAVVRGVQRRAGDASAPVRLDGVECARAAGLDAPARAPAAEVPAS
jgi:hypothetical protein